MATTQKQTCRSTYQPETLIHPGIYIRSIDILALTRANAGQMRGAQVPCASHLDFTAASSSIQQSRCQTIDCVYIAYAVNACKSFDSGSRAYLHSHVLGEHQIERAPNLAETTLAEQVQQHVPITARERSRNVKEISSARLSI